MSLEPPTNPIARLVDWSQRTATSLFNRLPGLVQRTAQLAYRTWLEFGLDHGMTLAAALAYTSAFAIFPLLLAVISTLGFLLGSTLSNGMSVEQYVLSWFASTLPGAIDIVASVLSQVEAERGRATVIGILFLIVGASALFGQLEYSLDVIFDSWPRVRNPLQMFLARVAYAVAVVAIILIMFVGAVVDTVVSVIQRNAPFLVDYAALAPFTTPFVTLILTILGFALLITVLPQHRPRFLDVLPAAAVGGIFWEVGKALLTWYLGRPIYGLVYGSLSWLFVLMLWFYYAAVVFLLSAELAATMIQARRETREQQERGAPEDAPRLPTLPS